MIVVLLLIAATLAVGCPMLFVVLFGSGWRKTALVLFPLLAVVTYQAWNLGDYLGEVCIVNNAETRYNSAKAFSEAYPSAEATKQVESYKYEWERRKFELNKRPVPYLYTVKIPKVSIEFGSK